MTENEQDKLYEIIREKLTEHLKKLDYSRSVSEEKKVTKPDYRDINLELAERLVKRAVMKAKECNINITAAVVDKGGNTVLLKRMDGAIVASIDVAVKKAYSALSLNCPTSQIDLREFPGLERLMEGKLVLFGGGYPVKYNNSLIGGIGISGGNSTQDEKIAIFAIEDVIKNL